MQVADSLPENLQSALSHGLLNRLPITFLPFVNQQLRQWNYLFPNERQSVERLLLFVASLTPQQSSLRFRDVVQIEEKMGVGHWQFSTSEQTISNSSELARSPYFQDWRRAVQAVFDQSDRHALSTEGATVRARNRIVLLNIPHQLPIDPVSAWRQWQGIGTPLKLESGPSAPRQSPFEALLSGSSGKAGEPSQGLLDAVHARPGAARAETWIVDAGRNLSDAVLAHSPSQVAAAKPIVLSYQRLDRYRQAFSHEMNTMRKDLADADAVFDHLRKVDVTPWCPPEVAADPAVREFLRSLYLSGNGAVIYGNSFVEWAASEAFRRARPSFLAASFGVRSKPKPFTGVAVFDNPDQINPATAVDDLPGSAIDAQMLALYVWLAAIRYDEYQRSTLCVCLAESIAQAYIIAPPEFALLQAKGPVPLDRLRSELRSWIA